MTLIVLIALGAAAVALARLYLFPFRHCRRCGGTGRKHGRLNRRTFSLCARCAGTGRTLRPGARLVHRAALGARSPHARARLQVRQTEAAERTQTPGRPAHQFPRTERSNP
jgi:hypothetical protein